jgi:hypothetical protein
VSTLTCPFCGNHYHRGFITHVNRLSHAGHAHRVEYINILKEKSLPLWRIEANNITGHGQERKKTDEVPFLDSTNTPHSFLRVNDYFTIREAIIGTVSTHKCPFCGTSFALLDHFRSHVARREHEKCQLRNEYVALLDQKNVHEWQTDAYNVRLWSLRSGPLALSYRRKCNFNPKHLFELVYRPIRGADNIRDRQPTSLSRSHRPLVQGQGVLTQKRYQVQGRL